MRACVAEMLMQERRKMNRKGYERELSTHGAHFSRSSYLSMSLLYLLTRFSPHCLKIVGKTAVARNRARHSVLMVVVTTLWFERA